MHFALKDWALLTLWTPGETGQRRGGHHWELGSFTQTLQVRVDGSGRRFIFTSKWSLHRKEIFESSGCGEPALREELQQVSKGTLSLQRTEGGSMWSLLCEWGAAGEIQLSWNSSLPTHIIWEEPEFSVGVMARPAKDNRSPVWKWWKESMMSVIVLTSWFPEAQPHAPAGTCSRRKRNMGGAHGLIIISLFSRSNTKENPSFVSNSFFARVTW